MIFFLIFAPQWMHVGVNFWINFTKKICPPHPHNAPHVAPTLNFSEKVLLHTPYPQPMLYFASALRIFLNKNENASNSIFFQIQCVKKLHSSIFCWTIVLKKFLFKYKDWKIEKPKGTIWQKIYKIKSKF